VVRRKDPVHLYYDFELIKLIVSVVLGGNSNVKGEIPLNLFVLTNLYKDSL